MNHIASALKNLAAGEFICSHRFPDEYEALESPEGREQAEKWLQAIGHRLARLHEEGAFFMAHSVLTTDVRAQVREEMRSIRSKLQPAVGILETVRQSQGRDPHIHAGDVLFASEIAEAARKSSMLETRILEARELAGTRPDESTLVRVSKMLEKLREEGYVRLVNENQGGYEITGKIDYLYQLIAYITAHAPHLGDEKVVDQIDQTEAQMRLAPSTEAGPQGAGA